MGKMQIRITMLILLFAAVMAASVAGAVDVPGAAGSGVPGRVTEVRGEVVGIRLDREASPAPGDLVELSYSVTGDTIPLGTWRVTEVRADGIVEAEPLEAKGAPTPRMDALVFATGSHSGSKKESTSSNVEIPDTIFSETPRGGEAVELFEEASRIQTTDLPRAAELFVAAARMGHAEAANQAGLAYLKGRGVPTDERRAAQFFLQCAEAGLAVCQNNYGALRGDGRGVAKDEAEAALWYRKAAAQGSAFARANLCQYLYEGRGGLEQDYQEALRLCRLAAEQENSSEALDNLGWMYQKGLGVDKDLQQAFAYYKRAAELGHENGQNNLAYMYEKGWGVARDYHQALHWYRKAAAAGSTHASWNMARMYRKGLGVPADRQTEIEFLQRAARAGHHSSRERLRELGLTW